MTPQQPEDRWEEIKNIWRDEKFIYQILGGLALVSIGVWIGAQLFNGDPGYATNLYTEVLSIGITVFVLDLLARHREEHREQARLKADLIRRMGSRINAVAIAAAEELWDRRWVKDGTLRKAYLKKANLQNVGLWVADLEGANLSIANLQGADLGSANLQSAKLWEADLRDARLAEANLQWARLGYAKLQSANLKYADLQKAGFEDAVFDANTTLPDGTKYVPHLGLAQLERFTNPAHPEFWRLPPKYYMLYEESDISVFE